MLLSDCSLRAEAQQKFIGGIKFYLICLAIYQLLAFRCHQRIHGMRYRFWLLSVSPGPLIDWARQFLFLDGFERLLNERMRDLSDIERRLSF